jgi:putative endonuclease
MKYYTYIQYSPSLQKYYTGISKFKDKRLRQHNKGQTSWTSQADDWIKIWVSESESYNDARTLEKKIKARGAKRFLIDNNVAVPPKAE